MASNYRTDENIPSSYETLTDRMNAYDRLPVELRRALDDCPVEQSPIKIHALLAMCDGDVDRAVRSFHLMVQNKFPGYTPPRVRARRPTK